MNSPKPSAQRAGDTLFAVPTAMERERLFAVAPDLAELERFGRPTVIGFGPIAPAATIARALACGKFSSVVLAGIAGTYEPETAPVGHAFCAGSVAVDGVGAGEGAELLLPSDMGFAQLEPSEDAPSEPIFERIDLDHDGPLFLTVCAAASGDIMLKARRKRFPHAVLEDMESFAVAVACRTAGVPLQVVRGVSNVAGSRSVSDWKIDDALRSVAEVLRTLPSPARPQDLA